MPARARQPECSDRNLCQRILLPVKIALLLGLIAVALKYVSDHTFNALQKDLYHLKDNLRTMQKDLHKVAAKKTDVEKQLVDISAALPELKEMAYDLQRTVKKMNSNSKKCDGDNLQMAIRQELDIYNADKTGRSDYALESSGASIITIRDTESLNKDPSILTILGSPLCHSPNSPRTMIQSGVMPGECWAFKGCSGRAVIRLVTRIHVTGLSLEHIARSISPTGETKTAPKEFSIWGLCDPEDSNPFFFGKFLYNLNGPTIQYFAVTHKAPMNYDIVEFKVHSNHGHPDYTCVYRLRVHGDLK